MKVFSILLLLVGLTLGAGASIGSNPNPSTELPTTAAVVRMTSPVIVYHSEILLGKAAEISTSRISERQRLNSMSLIRIPSNRNEVIVPASYIMARVREIIGSNRPVSFELPKKIVFRLQKQPINEKLVSEKIHRYLREEKKVPDSVKLEILKIRFSHNITMDSRDEIVVTARNKRPQLRGKTLFLFKITNQESKKTKTERIHANVKWLAKRWVAKRDISYKEKLFINDFERKEIEIRSVIGPEVKVMTKEKLAALFVNSQARQTIRKNSALRKTHILRVPDVRAGESVGVVLVGKGGLRIYTKGNALKNGFVGSRLRVRLHKTGKVLSGDLKEKGLLEIKL